MQHPRDARAFEYQPDPGDAVSFAAEFAVLTGGVPINPATLAVVTDAEDLGVRVLTTAGRAPALASDNTTVVLWIGVDAELRGSAAFQGMGLEVGVTIRFSTADASPRDFERTALLTVRNR